MVSALTMLFSWPYRPLERLAAVAQADPSSLQVVHIASDSTSSFLFNGTSVDVCHAVLYIL